MDGIGVTAEDFGRCCCSCCSPRGLSVAEVGLGWLGIDVGHLACPPR